MTKNNRFIFLILLAFSILLLDINISYSEDIETIINKIQKVYDSTNSLKAKFIQTNIIVNRANPIEAEGTVFFKKPGMMRWNYSLPEKQKIISNGRKLWVYQPRFKQVMVSKVPIQNRGIGQNFLSGMGRLRENFIIRLEKTDKDNFLLSLKPKIAQANMEELFLSINKKNFYVTETKIRDSFGNVTIVKFSKIRINPEIPSSLFKFKIPKGVRKVRPQYLEGK